MSTLFRVDLLPSGEDDEHVAIYEWTPGSWRLVMTWCYAEWSRLTGIFPGKRPKFFKVVEERPGKKGKQK